MDVASNLKILIVEDEVLLSFTMQEMLSDLGYQNIKIANSFNEAKESLLSEEHSLVSLDINLGEGPDGLELAKICYLKEIPFFYVTSYTDRKTLDLALETVPGAYVIKPIIPTNLYSAIQLSLQKNQQENYFSFKDSTNNIRLITKEILYLEADGIYLHIYTETKSYLTRMSLIYALEQLPEKEFIQIHRSFVVNHFKVTQAKSDSLFIGNKKLPISRTFKEKFKNTFTKK